MNSEEELRDLLTRVGARVRTLREERSWTRRQLAEACGLSLRFLGQVESGKGNIAIGRLARVARALDVDVARLVKTCPSQCPPSAFAISVPGVPETPEEVALAKLLQGRSPSELRASRVALERLFSQGEELVKRRPWIALLGLRGAGKSTFGPLLARACGLSFVELDERIERASGLSLSELFALHGEPYYRRLELSCLRELLAEGQEVVLALPGGVVHSPEAFALVQTYGLTVWLKANPEDHMQRVLAQGDRRPMAGSSDAMTELRRILADREPLYRQAQVEIDTSREGERTFAALLAAVEARRVA